MEATPYVPAIPPPPHPDHLSPTSEVHEPVSQLGETILTITMCVCLGVMVSLLIVLAFTTAEIAPQGGYRDRGSATRGLNIAKAGSTMVANAFLAATSMCTEDMWGDTLCPDVQRNIIVVRTPSRENAERYVRVREIVGLGRTNEGCGASNPETQHECTPEGRLCSGHHFTAQDFRGSSGLEEFPEEGGRYLSGSSYKSRSRSAGGPQQPACVSARSKKTGSLTWGDTVRGDSPEDGAMGTIFHTIFSQSEGSSSPQQNADDLANSPEDRRERFKALLKKTVNLAGSNSLMAMMTWGYPLYRSKGKELWHNANDIALALITDKTSPTSPSVFTGKPWHDSYFHGGNYDKFCSRNIHDYVYSNPDYGEHDCTNHDSAYQND
ncbi:hypothetical protein MTO96_033599 [Rhipicephalus appendiculatus]